MTLVVFGFTYLLAAAIYAGVAMVVGGERAKSFKTISPGMLSPLGVLFGLFVAFTAAQVWSDNDRANAAVSREVSALRAAIVYAGSFSGEPETRLRGLIRTHIEEVAKNEWPMMARRSASLSETPRLVEALRFALSLSPTGQGPEIAQREIISALETALDARRQRIISSRAGVNSVKWACLLVQAIIALLAIALVHGDNRVASAMAMGLFATGVAASVLLITAYDRPFTGQMSVTPAALLQIMPAAPTDR
jgi:hypothetical protein